MKPPLQVLHIEDSSADCELVRSLLSVGGLECNVTRIDTREELMQALSETNWDIILSDCSLPQFYGLEALQITRATKPDVPFIFVSGTMGEETAVNTLQNGATDFVLKEGLTRLVPAVRRALAEAESRNDRLNLEAQLRQAKKLETIGTLLGGIAHDFRNLLQILKSSLDLLPLVADDPRQVRHLSEQMTKTTDRGCDMMKEILVFARKTDAHLESVDLSARIRETAQYLRSTLPSNISLALYLEEDLPPIMADPSQVDRMITNLVGNARDAMTQGGDILISLDAVRFDFVHTNSWHIRDIPYLRVRISDNGTGMDETVQSRIFEPFFTTKAPGKGTGLGLSVVFGLIEAHQGYIDLQSKIGSGSIFSLFFPLPQGSQIPADRIEVITPTRLLGQTAAPGQQPNSAMENGNGTGSTTYSI